MEADLRLDRTLIGIASRWYVIAALAALGGALGFLVHLAQPPIYDSYAVMTVALNPDRTPPLTLYDRDLAMGKMAGIVSDKEVWQASLLESAARGETAVVSHWLARKDTRWELTVSTTDQSLSALLANRWAVVSAARLTDALQHAVVARDLQTRLDELQLQLARLQATESANEDGAERIADLSALTDELEQELLTQLEAARGVASFATFEITEEAQPPEAAATRGTGQMVLAGGGIGILAGLLIAGLGASRGSLLPGAAQREP